MRQVLQGQQMSDMGLAQMSGLQFPVISTTTQPAK